MYDILIKKKLGSKVIFTSFLDRPYFVKQSLVMEADHFSISKTSLNTLIQRSIKDKTIIPLKRNYYVTGKFFMENRGNTEYRFFLANLLLGPSYISRESALQCYGLLTESVANYYTSTSIKTRRKFRNRLGIFEYFSIKKDLFNGYNIEKFKLGEYEYTYAIAEPSKAIYDYLYYRTKKRKISKSNLFLMLDEYRINYTELSNAELNRLIRLFK
ncbi:MAG: hypothetical protein WCK31_02445, partial [bacterium]